MNSIGLKILIVAASLGVGGVAGGIIEAIGDPSAISGAIVGGVVAIVGLLLASFAPPTPSSPL